MARTTRSSARLASTTSNGTSPPVKQEKAAPAKRKTTAREPPAKRIKTEDDGETSPKTPLKAVKKEFDESPTKKSPSSKSSSTPDALRSKKLKAYAQYASKSPFPDFPHPTPDEARLAHRILSSLHGARKRPTEIKAPTSRAGCGDSPSVLDALVRTILSQNTSDTNSTRAKRSMDAVYGGSDAWEAIAAGGPAKLQEAIKCGGLAGVKSKVITNLLAAVHERHGSYSLDHLFSASDDDAMRELIGFPGVGPKTASCVLLFCLGRESFAVDTHVWRITGLLGWRPATATRDETYAHLDVRIPDEDKYGLHILLVGHGKKCEECRAGGKNLGKCELRRAFKKGAKGVKPEMPDIKEESGVKKEVKEEGFESD